MSQNYYLTCYNNEKYGVFQSLNNSILFILGNPLFELNNIDKWKIKSIYPDSFFILHNYEFKLEKSKILILKNGSNFNNNLIEKFNSTLKSEEEEENDDESQSDSVASEEIEEIQNLITETNDIQYKLNLLKKDKEKLEEKKNIFLVDQDLYFKFKQSLETDDEFTVPEIFVNKYKVFRELEEENNLCWEEFNKRHIPEKLDTSYNSLFFNEQFLDNRPSSSDSDSSMEI
jgi:hypothetical protein